MVKTTTALKDASIPFKPSAFRQILPQIFACMATSLLMFGLGYAIGLAAVVIPAVNGSQKDKYPLETVRFSDEQASWFGGLIFITMPPGSLIAGWINDRFGRKRAILQACLPQIVAWILLYFSQTYIHVFAATILLGVGNGLIEPCRTYMGEISQASLRGVLLTYNTISLLVGSLVVHYLNNWMTWRESALVGFTIPLLAGCVILFLPETPHWLIGHNRVDDARRSLCWLRGWLPGPMVETELQDIMSCIQMSNACDNCRRLAHPGVCNHVSSYRDKIEDLFRTKALRPLGLLLACFFVVHSSGNIAVRPYLVQLFTVFRFPVEAQAGLVLFSFIDFMSNVFCLFAIPLFGKRNLFLFGSIGGAISCFAIGTNAFFTIPIGTSSFDNHTLQIGDNYYAMVSFVCLAISACVSSAVPWIMIGEIYPFRVRGIASSLTTTCSYIIMFTECKTYINIERSLSIGGAFFLYGFITTIGLIVMYQILPETNGRTLEEIEIFFSDKTRKLTDRHIRRAHRHDSIEPKDVQKPFIDDENV